MAANVAIALYELFSTDATLQTLLGGGVTDKRVYREYSEDDPPVLSDTYPAFIILSCQSKPTINDSSFGRNGLWQVRVVAKDPDTRDSAEDRVRALASTLYSRDTLTIDSTNQLRGGNPSSGPDGYSDELKAYVVNVRFTVQTIANIY